VPDVGLLADRSKYVFLFKPACMWNEFPGKLDLGIGDTSKDLVALTQEGDYWAIQCKYYQETSVFDRSTLDSFITTFGGAFKDEQMRTARFSHRLWISTANKWGPNAMESIRIQYPPGTSLNLYDLN
jgi:predicted helicase